MALPMATPQNPLDDLTADDLNADIRRNIETLMAWRGVRTKLDLAKVSGLGKTKLYDRFNGKSADWTSADLLAVAKALRCSLSDLTADPETLMAGVRTGRFPMLGLPTPPQLELPFTSERTLTVVGSAP